MDSRFPYLEFPYPGVDDIDRRRGVRLIKTHLPIHLLPEEAWKAKVIYIYRNPKDVAVSFYHFVRSLTYTSYVGSLEQFTDTFVSGESKFCNSKSNTLLAMFEFGGHTIGILKL